MATPVFTPAHGHPRVTPLTLPDLTVFFQSQRAKVDEESVSRLVEFIEGTKTSLDCAIYDLKHVDILHALKDVSSRAKLRIAYDGGRTKQVGPNPSTDPKPAGTAQAIAAAGLAKFATPVHEKGGHLMHDKFLVRDGNSLWTGSGNFTHGGLELQDNNYLLFDSSSLAKIYTNTFEDLLQRSHAQLHLLKKKAAASPTAHTLPIKVGQASVTPFFAPAAGEGVETAVAKALQGASKVRMISMLVSDPGILEALLKLKKRDVKGIVDPYQMKQVMHPPRGKSKVPPKFFWFAQGDKRFVAAPSHAFSPEDNNDFMHNKILIINDKTTITGSYNLSENAEANDENLLLIESHEVAAAYTRYFDALFAQYQKHGAKLPPM
jgi:phosphatidylserine/phosphatidylglycerophosphate/cardiolipin synthase-like enzyme